MTQKKKDFTGAAAAAFGSGNIIDRIIAPQPQRQDVEPQPATGGDLDAGGELKPDYAALSLLPTRKLNYQSKDGNEVRMTFMVTTENHDKMRRMCFATSAKQKDVVNAALRLYFDTYEKKHGKL